MHLPALATLSLFVGASLATVISVPQDIVERAIAATPHPTGACGSKSGSACHGSEFGLCCSKDGECGSSDKHCGGGCQGSYGHCRGHGGKPDGHSGVGPNIVVPLPFHSTYGPVPTSLAYALSTNGRCGVNYRFFCNGSRWGNCCSEDNYCGSTDSFCGTGCQDDFGDCVIASSSSIASSSTVSSPPFQPSFTALAISTNGICGKTRGLTCQGSTFGVCCGPDGLCGLGAACGLGCQSDAGLCAVLPSTTSSSISSTTESSSSSSSTSTSSSSLSSSTLSSSSIAISSSVAASSVSASAFPIPSSNGTGVFVKRAIEKRAEMPLARKLGYSI